MMNIQIVPMVTDEDINGKGYVHWKSWHETYTGLVDPAYMEKTTLEKLSDYDKIAVWVLKGNDKAIRFYEKYGFRFDGTEKEIMLGMPNTELRMIYTR